MKIFQIINGLCYWDATKLCPNIEATKERFPSTDIFVETPDYVFEGWGYNAFKTGDERFIKPVPPEGWLYDDDTGTFYEEGTDKPLPSDPQACLNIFKLAFDILSDGL